jgi:PleD family two-component response regulator
LPESSAYCPEMSGLSVTSYRPFNCSPEAPPALYATAVKAPSIFHVSSRKLIQKLRDDILRIHGFEVASTLSFSQALEMVQKKKYDLVLIDVEGENRVAGAELLCDAIKKAIPDQRVAYVCNHRISFKSDCPDEIIRAEFNPELLVCSVREMIADL